MRKRGGGEGEGEGGTGFNSSDRFSFKKKARGNDHYRSQKSNMIRIGSVYLSP